MSGAVDIGCRLACLHAAHHQESLCYCVCLFGLWHTDAEQAQLLFWIICYVIWCHDKGFETRSSKLVKKCVLYKSNKESFVSNCIFNNHFLISFKLEWAIKPVWRSQWHCQLWAGSGFFFFLWDNLLILYSQSNMCRGVPQAGKENTVAVEPSLHCNGNAVSLGLIGT